MKFELGPKEVKEAEKFIKTHKCPPRFQFFGEHITEAIDLLQRTFGKKKKKKKKQKNKGEFSYIFKSGGGIGTAVYVRCENCRCLKDVTDYSMW